MKPLPQLKSVTGITVSIIALVAAVVYAVLYMPGASDDLKTIVVQSILLALAAVTGYWLNSSADVAKKDEVIAEAPKLQVDVPAQTIDALPPKAGP